MKWAYLKCKDYLAIEGDFAVWIACSVCNFIIPYLVLLSVYFFFSLLTFAQRQDYLMVANWKKQKMHRVLDMGEMYFYESKGHLRLSRYED